MATPVNSSASFKCCRKKPHTSQLGVILKILMLEVLGFFSRLLPFLNQQVWSKGTQHPGFKFVLKKNVLINLHFK